MALGSVDVALLVLVFAPVLAGLALVDLLSRVELSRYELTIAHLWCIAIVAAPVVGAALYLGHGHHAIDQFVTERAGTSPPRAVR